MTAMWARVNVCAALLCHLDSSVARKPKISCPSRVERSVHVIDDAIGQDAGKKGHGRGDP
jgi:hypothetical protein